MSMLKKKTVVMLPTNEKAGNNSKILSLRFNSKGKLLLSNGALSDALIQYLYFLSNEQIKKGFKGSAIVTVKDDVKIHYLVNVIVTEDGQCYCDEDRKFSFEYYSVREIIATTDSSLKISKSATGYTETRSRTFYSEESLPQPSQSFIERYFEKYNKGEQITEVMVEYEPKPTYGNNGSVFPIEYQLKINSKDNTITIKPIKYSWSKDEVIQLCNKAHKKGRDKGLNQSYSSSSEFAYPTEDNRLKDFDKWIEQNL